DRPLMARTRMQPAIPISVADRVTSWREPLVRHHERLQSVRGSVLVIQFGGAVGTLEKFADKGAAVRAVLARRLGLGDA
ncbi:MAG: 3-carboxy-cis,cis-muconate cycloisomerase, partial [Mesorhizobium sp.]